MEHYVNIMLDSGFKAVFGDKQVMMDFINAALYDEREVADLNYMDKEISPELSDGRTVIFDLLCEDTDGAKFIVEMQNAYQTYFKDRALLQPRFLLYLSYDLPSRREGPGVEIRPAPGIWNLPVELQPSRVPFMANGRGSGKRVNRSDFWADPAETDLYLFRMIRFALRGVRYSVRKNNLCTEEYEPV